MTTNDSENKWHTRALPFGSTLYGEPPARPHFINDQRSGKPCHLNPQGSVALPVIYAYRLAKTVRQLLGNRRLAVDAGLERAHTFTSESLRAGAVQHLMAHGATLDQIRQSAGWKTYRGIQRQAAWTPNAKPLPWGRYKNDR